MNEFDLFWRNLSIAYYGDCGKYDSYEDKDALYEYCGRFACYKDVYSSDFDYVDYPQCPYNIPPSDYIGEIYYP